MTQRSAPKRVALPLLCAAVPLAGLALTTLAAPPKLTAKQKIAPNAFEASVRPFLTQYCIACHQSSSASAGLNLTPFLSAASLSKDPEIWQHIVLKVRTGLMPPPGSPHADAAKTKAFSGWLAGELDRLERQQKPESGRVTARRLNRAEYNNTVRDLLGVDTKPADDFPQDDSGYGFDNIGDVLSLSPPLMEKYLATAEKVARTAIFGSKAMQPRLIELRTPHRNPPPPAAVPKEYDLTGLTLPSSTHVNYRFPVDGKYQLQVVLNGLRSPTADPMHISLWIDGKKVEETQYAAKGVPSFPGGPIELYGQIVAFPKQFVSAGDHWIAFSVEHQFEGLPPSFGGPNPSKQPEPEQKPSRSFEPPKDATPEQLAKIKERQAQFQERIVKQRKELLTSSRLNQIQIGGPYDQQTAPSRRSQTLLYPCGHLDGHHEADCARKIVSNLARRAFRRPVSASEIAPYLRLVSTVQRQGDSFEEGLCVALQAMLVSPHFLFRIERDASSSSAGSSHPLNDHELASRISYFLWSSLPDAELMRSADRRNLAATQYTGKAGHPNAARPKGERIGGKLRGAMAGTAETRIGQTGHGQVQRL